MHIPAVRETLIRQLTEILQRNARVANRLRHGTELPDDWIDRAPLLADEEVLAELDAGARDEVLSLRAALARLDDGSYGTCALCGDAIPDARLHSLPTAATCVTCAE